MLLSVQSHYRKVTQGIIRSPEIFQVHISIFLWAWFSSPIIAGNGGHCPIRGNDSAWVFCDAIIGDGFASDSTIYQCIPK